MTQRILEQNKKKYLQYNDFRKRVFSEISYKESEIILYLLPWLLSVNHQDCPGYLINLKRPFRVFNIDNEPDIRKREAVFKHMFNVNIKESLLKPPPDYCLIQGLYTIGSVGTVSQTSTSDCDIWVCYNKNDFDKTAWVQLNQKVNLIKDWIDIHLKMPIFFFISDVSDIKNGNFGSVSSESSGSAQKNILKDEFYRTCILICGKIPLWWVCYDKNYALDYNQLSTDIKNNVYGLHNIVDLGNLEKVESNEYFGAALWQLYKSLMSPFKSIIKLNYLQMLLEVPEQRQIGYLFRENILSNEDPDFFPDSSIFTMIPILDHYKQSNQENILAFLAQCFYMRCEIDPRSDKYPLKRRLVDDLIKKYPIGVKTRYKLNTFDSWSFSSQVEFGNRFFHLLIQIYREISSAHSGVVSDINKQDLAILGRKLSASYQKKDHKISIIQKIKDTLNLSRLIISLEDPVWKMFPDKETNTPISTSENIIYNIAFLVWNNLFDVHKLFMIPNASSVTIQEIINLGNRMKEFFGTFDISNIEYHYYLKKDHITKLMVVVSFERSPWEKDINDFCLVFANSWGELFVKKINSIQKLNSFLKESGTGQFEIAKTVYLQRNCTSYDKIIARTKKYLEFENIFLSEPAPPAVTGEGAPVTIDRRLRIIQKYISKMPSLPTTVTKVIEICNRPNTSPNDLNRVISLDPVLTGQVLKLVNSAYYYLFNKVTSLTRAIIMLGLNTVKNLVLSKAIIEIMGDKKSFRALSMDDFWTHSICVGVTAKSIAAIKGIPLTGLEEYFVSGLLHDLGKIPLNNRFPEEYMKVLESAKLNNQSFHQAEYSVFGMDHCIVGRMISEKWNLNDTINDTLCYHHNPGEAGEENRKLVETVALADSYAKLIFSGDFDEESHEHNELLHHQLSQVGISWQMLSDLKDTVMSEIEKAKIFLQPTPKHKRGEGG